jgi:hypothetical protein
MEFPESNIILLVYNTGITVLELLFLLLTGYALSGARILSVLAGNGTNAENGIMGKLQDAKRNRHIAFIVLLTFSLHLFQPLSTILLVPYSKCVYTDGIKVTVNTNDKKMQAGLNSLAQLEGHLNTTENHVAVLIQTGRLLALGEGINVSKSSIQYRNIKAGYAKSPGSSLWGTAIDGRNTYTISKEFNFMCDPGTVVKTYNPGICVNSSCGSSGVYCDMIGSPLPSSSEDHIKVHNIWILGILPPSENGTNFDGHGLATYNKVNDTLTVLGVNFGKNEVILGDYMEGDITYFVSAKKDCPWINPRNIVDDDVQLKESNSKCIVKMVIYCQPSLFSNNLNCYTGNLATSIWVEMEEGDVDDELMIGFSSLIATTEVYGNKNDIKRVVGNTIADISFGAVVSEEPWCNAQASFKFVRWAPFSLIILLIYLSILGYYIYKSRNSIISIPSSPLDGVKIAQRDTNHFENNMTTTRPEQNLPVLFGIKYNNVDGATGDYYGITTTPQRYRRLLLNTPTIK